MLTPVGIFDAHRFPRVGKCIYCGSTDKLTDEHVLPLGLSGTAVLPDASCTERAKITGKVEQDVLRGPMQQVGVFRGSKRWNERLRRRSHFPPTTIKRLRKPEHLLAIPEVRFGGPSVALIS